MSRISSIVTASEPNRIVEMNRRARFHAELTRPRAPVAGESVMSTSTLARRVGNAVLRPRIPVLGAHC